MKLYSIYCKTPAAKAFSKETGEDVSNHYLVLRSLEAFHTYVMAKDETEAKKKVLAFMGTPKEFTHTNARQIEDSINIIIHWGRDIVFEACEEKDFICCRLQSLQTTCTTH